MVIIQKSGLDSFTAHLNSIHDAIKFTIEHELNNRIAMLDTLITRAPNGKLSFSVYRKSTYTDQYLSFASHQPLEHKLGVIRTLTHRAETLSSDQASLDTELQHVKRSLSICGYTKWAWNTPHSKKVSPKPKRRTDNPPKGHITLPYVQGVSEAINRKIRQAGVTVHSKPANTIRSMLVSPKDKPQKLERTGSIYQIKCGDCPSTYVGESERALSKRISEHKRESSPVGAHMKSHKHSFDPKEVNILDTEQRWYQRGVKESIYIATNNPDLNQDRGRHRGRHHLPKTYGRLLESHRSISQDRSRDSSTANVYQQSQQLKK
ncbi:uncharacterized protein [Amphiura filiformis]|uniref:uncharacterized protein n=1 Tax=Amphiura filiformis TaxID=82378 RepID=UPI003B21F4A0